MCVFANEFTFVFVWLQNVPVKFRLEVTKWISKCLRFEIKLFDLLINFETTTENKTFEWVFENCLKREPNSELFEIANLNPRRWRKNSKQNIPKKKTEKNSQKEKT